MARHHVCSACSSSRAASSPSLSARRVFVHRRREASRNVAPLAVRSRLGLTVADLFSPSTTPSALATLTVSYRPCTRGVKRSRSRPWNWVNVSSFDQILQMPTCVIRITDENGVTVSERACCSASTRFISPPPIGRQTGLIQNNALAVPKVSFALGRGGMVAFLTISVCHKETSFPRSLRTCGISEEVLPYARARADPHLVLGEIELPACRFSSSSG